MPAGIIQFINKVSPIGKSQQAPITDKDVRKFKELSDLIGIAIDNTSEANSTLVLALEVAETMTRIEAVTDLEDKL